MISDPRSNGAAVSPHTNSHDDVDTALFHRGELARLDAAMTPGDAVFVGIGLCSPRALSEGLPFDAIGYVGAAEVIRRRADLARVVVLVADDHAFTNRWADASAVAAAGKRVHSQLTAVTSMLNMPVHQVLASSLLHDPTYRAATLAVPRWTGAPYARRQIADVNWAKASHNIACKLGWAFQGAKGLLDERALDQAHGVAGGSCVPFVYSVPGRNDDAHAPRCCPYTLFGSQSRLGLLSSPSSPPALRGTAAHLSSICDLVEKLSGVRLDGSLLRRVSEVQELVRRAAGARNG